MIINCTINILGGETQPTPGNEAQPGIFQFLLLIV